MGWVFIVGLGILLMVLLSGQLDSRRKITLTEFWTHVHNGQFVGVIEVATNQVKATLSEEVPLPENKKREVFAYIPTNAEEFVQRLEDAIEASGASPRPRVEIHPESWWTQLLPQILLFAVLMLVVWFFVFRRLGGAGGGAGFLGNFGRSRHRVMTKEQSKITFDDVAGIQEAKEEVMEIVEFLRDSRKFQRLGGRVPRGVLLIGQPGCGKTLLAKAIAGEAEVPFFSISGSDFVEMFVGVGASRVRDLFKQAKDASPCIIFLDEIDAVGRKRGVGFNGGGHDEREQTLNAILVEMDGFDSSDQVIVIAATNRADVLDPALTRPGRFDRQIQVPMPDLKGRYEILKIYADRVRCGEDTDLERIARGTSMFSGADLAALVNEAAIAAAMAGKDHVEHADLEEARDKVRWGRSRRSRVIDDREKEITAYHEAGHAVVQYLLPDADPLHKVSIIPRGPAGGATFSLPEKDRHFYTQRFCESFIRICMAGRICEQMFLDEVDSGAASDIQQATKIARHMVMDWGMSPKLGFVRLAPEEERQGFGDMINKDYSEQTADVIDSEIRRIMDESERETKRLLDKNREKVEKIAQALLKYETLTFEDVDIIMRGGSLDKPTVHDLIEHERRKQDDSEVGKDEGVTHSPEPGPGSDMPPLPEPS
jgi:cell division protease FtsH